MMKVRKSWKVKSESYKYYNNSDDDFNSNEEAGSDDEDKVLGW